MPRHGAQTETVQLLVGSVFCAVGNVCGEQAKVSVQVNIIIQAGRNGAIDRFRAVHRNIGYQQAAAEVVGSKPTGSYFRRLRHLIAAA